MYCMRMHKLTRYVFTISLAVFIVMICVTNVNAEGETSRHKDHKLLAGVWESTVYVTDSKNINNRVHILRIDHNADVTFKASSAKHYTKNSTKVSREEASIKWGYANVSTIMSNYNASLDTDGNAIAGINGDFYDKEKNGETLGKLIAEGKVLNPSSKEPFFAVMDDGSYRLMAGGSDTSDVIEAVAGDEWLVKNGAIVAPHTDTEIRSAIGITAEGDVVIVCVDGREPTSMGCDLKDLAWILQKQGCKNAINLDGGGSVTFVTKRSTGKATMRNTPGDGLARTVSSALLVVKKNKEGDPASDEPAVSMKKSNTSLTKKSGYYYYKENGKKANGFRMVNGKPYLFNKSGKGLTKTVKIGKTKYYFKKGALSTVSDKKAGDVGIGFCGSSKDKQNLIYSYHYGNKKLSVGLNPLVKNNSGKMEDWKILKDVPWVSMTRKIKTVHIGSGVKNVGSHFLYLSRNPVNDDAKDVPSVLTSISLPGSLKTIGDHAFYNNAKLRKVTIPKKVTVIGTKAFAYDKNMTYTFKSTKPPKIGKNAFQSSGKKSVIKAPGSKKWKAALKKSANKKKWGFTGKVKYTK